MSFMKTVWQKLQGWKTVLFNVLAAILPVLSLTEWHDVIPPEYLKFYILGVAIINVLCRHYTVGPIGYKKNV